MSTQAELKIALVQSSLVWQAPQENRAHFETMLKGVEADLVVLPEMFTTGFSMQPAALAEPERGETHQWIQQLAKTLNAVVCGTVITQASDGSYRNRLLWATPDGEVSHYDKRHLFRMAGEHEVYAAGTEQCVFNLHGWRIRPLICYDLRFPVWSRDAETTDVLLYTANWPAARRHHWNALIPARSIENLCYTIAVNRIGEDGKGNAHAGDSQACDFEGRSLVNAENQEGVFIVTLDGEALRNYKERFPAHLDADGFSLG